MRSATSCFNKTLIRTDVKRFWPLLFLYTAAWILMLPVYQWVDQGYRFGNVGFYPGDYLYDMMFAGLIMAVIFGGLFSMAVFSYLMNSRSVGLMHSLPVSRGAQFVSHVVSVMGMLTVGKLLVAVLTVAEQAIFGSVAFKEIALWLLVCTLLELFFLSLGVLCNMVTGWLLAAPVLYAVVNCLALMVTQLLRLLGELFYFGYANSYGWPAVTRWLTPVYTLGEVLGDTFRPYTVIVDDAVTSYNGSIAEVDAVRLPRELNPEAIGPLAVYTFLGLLLLAVSYLLYTRRASESAGDPVAFDWARPIFRYTVALLGGLALGIGLFSMLTVNSDEENLAVLMICFVLMGILCYFAVEMVIRKSFRVFRKGWPGAIAVAAVLILVCVGAKLDITGYEDRLPDKENIVSVELNIYQEDVYSSELTDSETIDAVLALHKVVAAEGRVPVDLEGNYGVNLEYTMEDGSIFRRRYTLSLPAAMESDAITEALEKVINCEEVRYRNTLNGKNGLEELKFRGGYISGRYTDYNQQLTAEDARRIYDAVLVDLANGAGGQEPFAMNDGEAWPECAVYIELEAENNGVWLDRIRPDFKELTKVLNELGLDSATLFQVDPAYAEKYGW